MTSVIVSLVRPEFRLCNIIKRNESDSPESRKSCGNTDKELKSYEKRNFPFWQVFERHGHAEHRCIYCMGLPSQRCSSKKGWFPENERLSSSMVSPMLSYLLPILIAGQGGYMVAKERGRVIACIAVIGCICGSDYTMLMGAMVMGPLAGWVIKQFDNRVEEHIPAGFLKCWSTISPSAFSACCCWRSSATTLSARL